MPPLSGAAIERRRALRLMAASVALAGLGGCDGAAPDGTWVPAVVAPPGIIPGVANHYATASVADGTALGIVVTHRMGRPVKVEGNPDHPSSLGATDAVAQASILDFYDPDRALGIQHEGRPSEGQSLLTALTRLRDRLKETRGAGFRILSAPTSSPTLAGAVEAVLRQYPEARWDVWEASGRAATVQAARLAYGRPVAVLPRLRDVDVLLALDSDLLSRAPGHVRFGRDLASRRNPARGRMSRIHAAEPAPTLCGVLADHRHPVKPSEIAAALPGLLAAVTGSAAPGDTPPWMAAAAADLKAAGARGFVHAGPDLPAEAQALVHAVNEALGGRGHAYDLIEPPFLGPDPAGAAEMGALLADMEAGRVEALLVLGANPAYALPGFTEAMRRVPFSLALSPLFDETGQDATWWVPETHPFEAWGDAHGHDGTATVMQPQALPLHGGRTAVEVLSLVTGSDPASARDAVRQTWKGLDDDAWTAALRTGTVPGTAAAPLDVALRPEAAGLRAPAVATAGLRVLFRPDEHIGDGQRANNAWLQELPRPFTKLVWDNPLLVSPALARAQKLERGDVVELRMGGQAVQTPVWVLPGLAPDCAVATLGYGRRRAGAIGTGVGTDFFPLQAAGDGEPVLRKTGKRAELACTDRRLLEKMADGADILRRTTLAAFEAGAEAPGKDNPPARELLYREHPPGSVQWGMSVDLNACIGCNACVVACQAENNVPVVGKANVIRQREMHWLRIDRYDAGPPDAPETAFQPMLCQHCEQAPCEVVCPVEAAVHDQEGLNLQVYNRCVGTRFCSNNCPYKVRRFNFSDYTETERRPALSRNPDVTVRARGVMEKCTFCVQRIAEARIAHDRDGVPEQAVTACQAACPTGVFAFGDLNDPASDVVARKKSRLDYPVLPETSTYPRVTYEARVRNANGDAPA